MERIPSNTALLFALGHSELIVCLNYNPTDWQLLLSHTKAELKRVLTQTFNWGSLKMYKTSHKIHRIPKRLHRYTVSGLQSPVSTLMGGSYEVFVSNQEQPKSIKLLTLTCDCEQARCGGHNASWTHPLLKILWFKLSPTDPSVLWSC